MTEPEDIDTLSQGTRFPEAWPTAVRWSHALLTPRLHAGDVVVDATAGNGHDTLFLARHVLPGGRVFSFDVQSSALEATRILFTDHASRVTDHESITLIHAGHEKMAAHLPPELKGKIRAFMFNLGWLPGSDKTCVTQAVTTIEALRIATDWIGEGGLITVVCYPGHEGGDAEAKTVESWVAKLSARSFEVQKIAFLNLEGKPPHCLALRRRPRVTSKTFD
jgi:hypothetical protein